MLFFVFYTCRHYALISPCRSRRWCCGVPEKSLIFGVLWNVVETSSYLTTFERSASPYVEVVDFHLLLPLSNVGKAECCLRCR